MRKISWRIFRGLIPDARTILDRLRYYEERNLQIPSRKSKLTKDEKEELKPIARPLIEAAIKSVQMRDGVLVTTLDKVAKNPSLFFDGQLPAAVQWEMANDYQRDDEQPGTFGMDIWGNEKTGCTYSLQPPTEANIQKAAEAALSRIEELRTSGRPPIPANRIIAFYLGRIFRSSGHSIVRRRESTGKMFKEKVIYAETGPFYDFLELVLPPLQRFLSEQRLPPVTIKLIIRLAAKPGS